MVVECLSIIGIIVLMSYMYFRSGRGQFALAILPLILVPVFHIMGGPVARFVVDNTPLDAANLVLICMDIIAMVISCVIFGIYSHKFMRRRPRRIYLFCCAGFTIVLAWVLIFNTIHPTPLF